MEEIEMYLDEAKSLMDKAVDHVVVALSKIRAGKASPSMLDSLMVEYYGSATPLNQVASITTPDARTIMIKPWEKTVIPDIERAIINIPEIVACLFEISKPKSQSICLIGWARLTSGCDFNTF